MPPIERIAVIGAGSMGHGIAQVAGMAGFNVILIDVNKDALESSIKRICWSLNRFVEKGKISGKDKEEVLMGIKTSTEMGEASSSDFVIEAVPEKIELKKGLFAQLDRIVKKDAVLASNTSSLSISEISTATSEPTRVIGMHFFNPPQLMKLVEVVKGKSTSEKVVLTTLEVAKRFGKKAILAKKDVPGSIVNRILYATTHEGLWAVYNKENTLEEVDSTVKQIVGIPMGLFELFDYTGLDVMNEVDKILYKAYGERMSYPPIVEDLVSRGMLGQKTGQGFYNWKEGKPSFSPSSVGRFDIERMYTSIVNEASFLIYEDVTSPEEIDVGMKLGTNWPKGPCEIGDEIGLDNILSKLKELQKRYGNERYKPCPLLETYVKMDWVGKKSSKGFYKYL